MYIICNHEMNKKELFPLVRKIRKKSQSANNLVKQEKENYVKNSLYILFDERTSKLLRLKLII